MDFSSSEHTKYVWEQIEQLWRDNQKIEGERFLGNNRFAHESTESLLAILAEDLSRIGSLSIDKLNARWGDRPNRNWVKIITFILSEYAYHNEAKGGFWESLSERLRINDTQSTKQTFGKILKEGFDLLGLVKAKGDKKYLATLYLQSGLPQPNLKHFAELVEDLADNLGWWNIAYRYESIDLAHTLYDRSVEIHPERLILKRFLKTSCQDEKSEQSYVEPLSGNILKYIATIALEIEHRNLNPKDLTDSQKREKYLQGFSLPFNFFLSDWNNLILILTPRLVSKKSANRFIRQKKRALILRLDTLELNLQLVLPEQNLWRKDWQDLKASYCQIPQVKWESRIPYPDSLEVPELCLNLNALSDRWIWALQDSNKQNLLEWQCDGLRDDFPMFVFDAETGDRIPLSPDNPQIIGVSEVVCYFPKMASLELGTEIEVTDACFPCLITDWQAKQIRLIGRSATFSLVSDSLHINLNINLNINWQWPDESSNQPILRGLQIRDKQSTYLETPEIYYPLSNSIESLHIQIENMDKQSTVTPPNTKIAVWAKEENWQQISLSQWIQTTGNYEVRLWQGNWHWSTSFLIKPNYQALPNPYLSQVQIQNAQQQDIFSFLPIKCAQKSDFWVEEIKIQGLWSFEPIAFILSGFILSGDKAHQSFSHSMQADQTGCLNLSLMCLREALPDSDRYSLDWVRLGNSQRLLETTSISS